jgi:hypothetical protein
METLMDIWEQFFIKKYYHKHKLIREQVPREIKPLFTLLFDGQIRHATTRTGLPNHCGVSV